MSDFRPPSGGDDSFPDPFGEGGAARPSAIRRQPMHVQVTDRVRELIVQGRLRPGERINEYDLAEFLDVSRTPLRETLRELQSEGLIVHEPNKGSRVSHITADHTAELFESLACIEAFCGEIATRKINDTQLHRFEALHDEMSLAREKGARAEYFDLNERIHRAFVILSGNTILTELHARLMVGARRIRFTAIRVENRWDISVAEHKAILAAMKNRDGQAVRQGLEAHLRGIGECVSEHIKDLKTEPARSRRPPAYGRRLRS